MSEPQRKPYELWTDEKNQLYEFMPVGNCKICRVIIWDNVPQNVMVTLEKEPLLCDTCRKGILKLIRPDSIELAVLEENVRG
jgi:hypothetical protein